MNGHAMTESKRRGSGWAQLDRLAECGPTPFIAATSSPAQQLLTHLSRSLSTSTPAAQLAILPTLRNCRAYYHGPRAQQQHQSTAVH